MNWSLLFDIIHTHTHIHTELLIPHDAVVYYALVNNPRETPVLLVKQKD